MDGHRRRAASWNRRAATALLALAPLALVSAGPPATDRCAQQLATDQRHYLHADQATANLSWTTGAVPSWSPESPTGSLTTGAGALFLGAWSPTGSGLASATFAGFFDGCLDVVQVDLYALWPTNPLARGCHQSDVAEHRADVQLEIDGVLIGRRGRPATTTELAGAAGRYLLQWSIPGLAAELGDRGRDPDARHYLRLTITPSDAEHDIAYLFDAKEVPSALVFNPPRPGADDARPPRAGGGSRCAA